MREFSKNNLYFGGIIGPIVFLLNDIIGSIITQGYSPIENAVSELTEAGSENAVLLSSLFIIAAIGLVVFAIGIVSHYHFRNNKLLFLGGLLIIFLGIFSALTGSIFPMDPFGEEATFPGEMHIILTGINIVLIVLAIPLIGIGLYREKKWKLFRLYSIITVIIMATCGGLSWLLLGLFERITIYGYQLWIFILSFLLLKENKTIENI